MARSIGDFIFGMMGKEDPRDALLAATAPQQASTPAGGGAYAAGADQQGGTAAPQLAPQATAYQSPPDLVSLYAKVMDREGANRMIDRGVGLIGASLAQEQNRASILNAFGVGSAGASHSAQSAGGLFDTIANMNKQRATLESQAAQRAALPMIAQRYGLDMATAQYLMDTGKLEDVIKDAEKPNRQTYTNPDGTTGVVDLNTAAPAGASFGGTKPRATKLVTDDNGNQFMIYEDDGTRVSEANVIEGAGATNDIKELNRANEERAAKGLAPIPMEEWVKTKGGSSAGKQVDEKGNVLPDLPKDMAWERNPDGSVKTNEAGAPIAIPIAGGTVDTANKEAALTKEKNDRIKRDGATFVVDNIDRALDQIDKGGWNTGPIGAVTQYVPGTSGYQLANTLTTIRSNIGFDKLQAMREASPTGGALGQVSDFENKLLQSTFGSLEQAQSAEDIKYYLNRIRTLYNRIINEGIEEDEAKFLLEKEQKRSGGKTAPAGNGGYTIIGVE